MPLHAAVVHFPIALFTLSVLLDVGSYFGGGNALVRGALYTLGVGLIGAAAAAVPGMVDYGSIRLDHPARATARWHLALNVVAVGLFAASLMTRWGRPDALRTPPVSLALSVIGFALIGVSGYLGGVLVFDDGIGVGRHRRRAGTPRRTLVANAGETDSLGFTPVADGGALAEGQTLRVDVRGTVIALARLGGAVYAFQEFCTHRYGPLSEGCFDEQGHVRCPWHNSRFDVRSGQVVHGPAKVPLRAFETQVRDGRIWVRVADVGGEALR
jgi:nitrite reductase/ring-hydroxylating ferredoxin subunit/uncharacterized membrane protein